MSQPIPTSEAAPLSPVEYFSPADLTERVEALFGPSRELYASVAAPADQFAIFALKMVSPCNLDCQNSDESRGYRCYEYVDESWKDQPAVMPDEVIRMSGQAIADYARQHAMSEAAIVFHGGEPLFVPHKFGGAAQYYDRAIGLLEAVVAVHSPGLKLRYSMQTNATLITEKFLEVAKRRNIRITCSLDGDEESHNRNRILRASSHRAKRRLGSFRLAEAGLQKLSRPEYVSQRGGLLSVIDIDSDPIACYETLASYGVSIIDFMLPYANHEVLPPGSEHSETPYADWLLTIFHRWKQDVAAGRAVPDIRQFRSIIDLSRSRRHSGTEALGMYTAPIAFIRADGQIEGLDALKMTGRAAVETDVHISDPDSLEKVAQRMRAARLLGRKSLAATCQNCVLADICGSGHVETRFSAERGLDNPSVYCPDLKKLIKEVVAYANSSFNLAVATTALASLSEDAQRQAVKRARGYSPLTLPGKSLPTRVANAALSDVASITDLHAEGFSAICQEVFEKPAERLGEFVEDSFIPNKYDYWRDHLEHPNRPIRHNLTVARLGRKIVGFSDVFVISGGRVRMNALYVAPEVACDYDVASILLRQLETAGLDKPKPIVLKATQGARQVGFFVEQGYRQATDVLATSPIIVGQRLPQIAMVRHPSV